MNDHPMDNDWENGIEIPQAILKTFNIKDETASGKTDDPFLLKNLEMSEKFTAERLVESYR